MPETHHAKLAMTDHGRGTLHIDGYEVERVKSVRIDTRVNEFNVVRIELAIPAIDFDSPAVVELGDETHAALVKLGWTPPPDAEPQQIPSNDGSQTA